MKTHFLSFLFCLTNISIFAQTHIPVIIVVEDGDSHKKIAGANVSIKENGYIGKSTDSNGKVAFDNVPVGEIEYNVSKDGYQFMSTRVNVTTEIKSNTFSAMIIKIPLPGDSKILVTGEVTDAEGQEVDKAWVEVKIADVERTVLTNESGNYTLDIVPNPKFPSAQIRIEVKKDDCKKTENIDMPRTNVIYKDFKLDCSSQTAGSSGENATPLPPGKGPLAEKTLDAIRITVERFEQRGSTATFYLKFENMKAAESVRETRLYFNHHELVDQEGYAFISNNISIGNAESSTHYVQMKLIYNTPVKGSVSFDVGEVKIKKAALLKLKMSQGSIEFTNFQVK